MQGIYAINKPKGPTSHDVVNQLRKLTGVKKIGHAGTLDPLANGVLVVAIGRESTKKLDSIVKKEKEYKAVIKFGYTSTTDDEQGDKEFYKFNRIPTSNQVNDAVIMFEGNIIQTPPVYSAKKINGTPAHRRVRRGENIKLEPQKVVIKKIDILKFKWPYLELQIVTGPGVYIRSLARDIGKYLDVGGYLTSLVRIRVGEYRIENSYDLDKLKIEDLEMSK